MRSEQFIHNKFIQIQKKIDCMKQKDLLDSDEIYNFHSLVTMRDTLKWMLKDEN